MEQRRLGRSGFMVPVLSFGTGTFGGRGEFFQAWGCDGCRRSQPPDRYLPRRRAQYVRQRRHLFRAVPPRRFLARPFKGRRDKVIISTKATFRAGDGANEVGSSRFHLIHSVRAVALKRLGTDYIDLFQLHGFDAMTPVEETLSTLDDLVRAGKIRYVGCSNFSGWHLMKSLAAAEKYNLPRYVAHQAYYSLIGRDYEWELMPLGLDQGVGAVVWSPLGWGRLTGKIRRGQPLPAELPPAQDRRTWGRRCRTSISIRSSMRWTRSRAETGKTVPQIALNWLLQRPTVANVIVGARNEEQLRQNLGAVGWNLTPEQVAKLDAASTVALAYPYWHQRGFTERNPAPV